jgi:hypothetical protein
MWSIQALLLNHHVGMSGFSFVVEGKGARLKYKLNISAIIF